MNKTEVIAYLNENKDPRGIAHWEKRPDNSGGLKSVGIGLTKLRKFAKGIGRDAKLARELWKSDIYEARIVSLLVDDPKTMTLEQAEKQVEQLEGGYLAHVFSSCDATLAKAPFVVDLLDGWVQSKDEMRRRCGYGLLYEVSKWKKKSAPDDEAFLAHIERIEETYEQQSIPVLMAMGAALMGIGMRNKLLNAAALEVAEMIGPIDFDPDGRCDPFDVASKLTSDSVTRKLGL
jgi:3-methyladenine DNA glycosylase AlkD